MGYESLSTVVVLVIVAIIIVVWLPVRTANGMKRATEHRQDRYSPSLHIVEAESGTRFGDVKPHQAKGAPVPASSPSARLTPEHIARVRELRRAAIRRRQLLAGALAAVSVLVFVLALALHFSTLFTLIPLALLAVVLGLGARAARQARRWEVKAQRAERARARKLKAAKAAKAQAVEAAKAAAVAAGARSAQLASGDAAREEAATEVMEQRQIRRALHDAEIEQARAKALRAAARAAAQAEAEASAAADANVASESGAVQADASAQSGDATAAGESSVEAKQDVEPSLTMRDERDEVADDATSELASVRPARALDVFDMATASQDLISFSLGEARNEGNAPQEPESREIKSTKQVSKAEPVGPETAEQLMDEAKVVKAADDAKAASEAQAAKDAEDVRAKEAEEAAKQAAFHESEQRAEVEAPDATSESLSVGLDSILARRGN
ncbi:magnesium transporter [Bifidobacterium sp. SO4]|uniref:magnesium transporter n=1 Tax=Bifidobacterium sp. SO4 TaxID=2809030 RepID=UPI001BDD458D|nr:magnesium transporter [Bifidobacterium sp. SO4]MBT1169885.1 magnesium transporter [Bifidobacterium sp. SO4]